MARLSNRYNTQLPAPDELDELANDGFLALSKTYHRLTTELYTPYKNDAERYTTNLERTSQRARTSTSSGPGTGLTWTEFFMRYARSCDKAASAAASVCGARRDAMEELGSWLRERNMFSQQAWSNHIVEAKRYEDVAEDWKRKASTARRIVRQRQAARLP